MSTFVNVYMIMIGWMPAAVQVIVIGFLLIFVVFSLLRLAGHILDAIPFL